MFALVSTVVLLAAICAPPVLGQHSAPEEAVTAIQEFIQAGKYPEALRKISAAMAAYPNDGGLLNLRGVIHAQQNELADARKDFEKAVTLTPGLTPAWQNLARVCQISIQLPLRGQCVAASPEGAARRS